MSNKKLIREYKQSLSKIKKYSESLGIKDDEFERIFDDCLECIKSDTSQSNLLKKSFRFVKKLLFVVIISFVVVYFINIVFEEKPINLILCKIQEFIYPGLRLLRILAIPVISNFPSLTELYDETCLIQNPYFRISDMDCWPCHSIKHVPEINDLDFEPQTSPPFLHKNNHKYVSYINLQKLYSENKKIFDKDAPKIMLNNEKTVLASDFFAKHHKLNSTTRNSYRWRINRMFPAQLVRTLFPRPSVVPRLGLSTERFVTIDEAGAKAYRLPDAECNFIFIIQSQGERIIELQPAKECLQECQTVKVLLSPSYLLWYNWWYWRPVSHPTDSKSTSISYVGSYC